VDDDDDDGLVMMEKKEGVEMWDVAVSKYLVSASNSLRNDWLM